FARLMLAGAMDVELDKQGRVVVPEYLRQYANLQKSAIIAGLYNRLEIWDEEKWEVYKKKVESDADAVAEQLGELGI
ncbi:TPA: cell division/cell wall cluster transcriptional repressor MraZ, partial [Candidatus Uhrbacteria bacterium]|nr:cell division/cell wall cluster transcriptional repressor MraZ [Candidatus Uhrbacteria bacterium]